MCYFNSVNILSTYEGTKQREFAFTENFKEENATIKTVAGFQSGTTIRMNGYALTRLKQYTYIQPHHIKQRILEEFYPKLFQLKERGNNVIIKINSNVEQRTHNLS